MELGQIVITKGAIGKVEAHDAFSALNRYVKKDWGDIGKEDWEANDYASENGERVLASYKDKNGVKFWIITEWDRSITTILLPEEY